MRTVLAIAVVLGLSVLPAVSFAKENGDTETPPGISKKDETPGLGLHKGWEQGEHKGWEKKEDLLKLKQENPEKFKEVIQQKRERIEKRMEYLKQNDPEKYQQIMQKIRERNKERLEELRKENPEKFKEVMQKRKEALGERLERLKVENPERYQQIVQRHKKIQELRHLKKEDPGKFKQYLKEHPGLRRHFEDIKDRREVVQPAVVDEEGKEKEAEDMRYEPRRVILNQELAANLDKCIAGLPKMQKLCFVLKHQNGLSNAEISQTLSRSISTVKVHLFRAVNNLRDRLSAYLLK
jgi:DNA-directed RNA polymerase specialized sigma24 family protein